MNFKKKIENKYKVYKKSWHKVNNSYIVMVEEDNKDFLIVNNDLINRFIGTKIDDYALCELTHNNAMSLRSLFKFTKPSRVLNKKRSIGLGDRLGVATIGHIEAVKKKDIYPVFAQQSIRELNLLNRTYEDVLDVVTFNVFKENFKRPFGADGDHLKKKDEIEYALKLGFTMITLDCSEHIRNDVLSMNELDIISEASPLITDELKNIYLDKEIKIENNILKYSILDLSKAVLIYSKAISFAKEIYNEYILNNDVDFELSIDETMTPTTPLEHFFVSNELYRNGVVLQTVAPRFCGEFQKGIDYIGDLKQFEKEIKIHSSIARHFKYKLSVHSGSDKFSIFKLVGKYTKGNFHIKTAGTNWLIAMELISIVNPSLYREMHKYALSRFNDATKFYHVTTNLNNIPDIDKLNDNELVNLFKNNDCRQLIHITYGYLLTEKKENEYLFKDRFYKQLRENKELYKDMLDKHISKHINLLYSGFRLF